MKFSKFLLITMCFLFLFNGKKYEQAVIERLSVPVKVCLEGQDCGSTAQASMSVAAAPGAMAPILGSRISPAVVAETVLL